MSKPKERWLGYVMHMTRRYPELEKKRQDLQSQSITPNYSGLPGGEVGRSTEKAALQDLTGSEKLDHDAVEFAVEKTRQLPNGDSRLGIIDLVYWQRTHNIAGAALANSYGEDAGQNFNAEFLRLVAYRRGILTKDDLTSNFMQRYKIF